MDELQNALALLQQKSGGQTLSADDVSKLFGLIVSAIVALQPAQPA